MPEQSDGKVSIQVAGQQDCLKKDETGVPDSRGSSQHWQQQAADHGLDHEQ
jgi:hypothetical protein